ncbi:MAG: hypothetical protein ACTSWN_07485 [Promethearchaeota archaeon]
METKKCAFCNKVIEDLEESGYCFNCDALYCKNCKDKNGKCKKCGGNLQNLFKHE